MDIVDEWAMERESSAMILGHGVEYSSWREFGSELVPLLAGAWRCYGEAYYRSLMNAVSSASIIVWSVGDTSPVEYLESLGWKVERKTFIETELEVGLPRNPEASFGVSAHVRMGGEGLRLGDFSDVEVDG
jgi:hypothetical protein